MNICVRETKMRYFDVKLTKWLIRGLLLIAFWGIYIHKINTYLLLMPFLLLAFINKRSAVIEAKPQWALFLLALTVTNIMSMDITESLKYIYLVFAIIFVVTQAKKAEDYTEYTLKMVVFFCMIETVLVILQYLMPTVINGVCKIILPQDIYSSMMNNYLVGHSYSGIAGDLPNAMFYSSILFAYAAINVVLTNRKRYLLVMLISIISIMLTGKRSAIVILTGALFIIAIVSFFQQKKISIKVVFFSIVIACIGLYILFFTSIGGILLEKNAAISSTGDLSNGRLYLIHKMFLIFQSNPIVGIGSLATKNYYGDYLGHNIYLQCLSENGIVGFLALIVLLISNLRNTISDIKWVYSSEYHDNEIYITYGYLSLFIQIFFIIYGFLGNPLYGPIFLVLYVMFSA